MKRVVFVGLLLIPFTLIQSPIAGAQEKGQEAGAEKTEMVADDGAEELKPPVAASQVDPSEIFDGDISFYTESLPERVTVNVRNEREVVNEDGEKEMRTFFERQSVDPRADNLTPEQRLALMISITEKQIQQNLAALSMIKDENSKEDILGLLKEQFQSRYAFDTAYQDFKTKAAEAKAAAQRADVDERKEAEQGWVDAMVTLAKTRAEGIETMDLQKVLKPAWEATTISTSAGVRSPSDLNVK